MGNDIIEKLGITPGPWKGLHGGGVDRRGNHHTVSGSGDIAIITRNNNEVANSLVIAAAPEMLEALIGATTVYENMWKDEGDQFAKIAFNKSSCIIQKATNKTWEEIKGLLCH